MASRRNNKQKGGKAPRKAERRAAPQEEVALEAVEDSSGMNLPTALTLVTFLLMAIALTQVIMLSNERYPG